MHVNRNSDIHIVANIQYTNDIFAKPVEISVVLLLLNPLKYHDA